MKRHSKSLLFWCVALVSLMAVSFVSCGDKDEPFNGGPIDGVYEATIGGPSMVENEESDGCLRCVVTVEPASVKDNENVPRVSSVIRFKSSDFGDETLERGQTIKFQIMEFEYDRNGVNLYDTSYFFCKLKPIK